MAKQTSFAPVLALARAWANMTEELNRADERTAGVPLRVFLDFTGRVADVFHSQVAFVEYVETARAADVRIEVKTAGGRGRNRRHTVTFIGLGRFENIEASARVDDEGGSSTVRDVPLTASRALEPPADERQTGRSEEGSLR